MINEFAVDPELFRNWKDVRYLTENFGVSKGRLISRYPKKWEQLVRQALDGESTYKALGPVDDNTHMRVVEKLVSLKDKMQTRIHEWDDTLGWLDNTEREGVRRPFHAVLTSSARETDDHILNFNDFDEGNPFWKVERERVVKRTAGHLAAAVAPLLKIARVLVFVDPHFDPYKRRACAALKAYLEAAVTKRGSGTKLEVTEFLTAFRSEIREYEAECNRNLPSLIPLGTAITIRRIKSMDDGDEMHNRYILTDRGGIRLAWGLDEGKRGQTDDVSLLGESVFTERWKQYCGEPPAFECKPRAFECKPPAFECMEVIKVSGTRKL